MNNFKTKFLNVVIRNPPYLTMRTGMILHPQVDKNGNWTTQSKATRHHENIGSKLFLTSSDIPKRPYNNDIAGPKIFHNLKDNATQKDNHA